MGERATIDQDYLYDIADAIRAKNGSSDTYTPPQMAAAIAAIPTGITPTGTVQITQNGTHDVTQYASANVNVQPNLQSKTATQNGTVTPDQGYDGLSSVVVNVSGGGGGVNPLQFNFGRLTINTGAFAESNEYCYSDLIPINQGPGRWFLDLARSDLESFYIGISFFAQDGETNVGYIRQYESYRNYQNGSGGNAKYFRIANKVSNLSFASASFLTEGVYVAPQSGTIYRINPV